MSKAKRKMVYPQFGSEYRLQQLPKCPECGSKLIVYTDDRPGKGRFGQVRCVKSGWPTMCKHRGPEAGFYKVWVSYDDLETYAINLYNGHPLE